MERSHKPRDKKRAGKTSTLLRKRALTAKLVSHQGWAVVR